MKQVEDNLDNIIQDREDEKKGLLLADGQSHVTAQSRFTVGSNVYSIVDSQRSILEDIDMKIR